MSKTKRVLGHGNQKYPWPLWENGEEHTVVRGVDFRRRISARGFQNQLHVRAARVGKLVETNVVSSSVVKFQFTPKDETAQRRTESRKAEGERSA